MSRLEAGPELGVGGQPPEQAHRLGGGEGEVDAGDPAGGGGAAAGGVLAPAGGAEDGPGLLGGAGCLEGRRLVVAEGAMPPRGEAEGLGVGVRGVPGLRVGEVAAAAEVGGDHLLAGLGVAATHHSLERLAVDRAGEAGLEVALELGRPADLCPLRGCLLGER